MLVCLTIVVVPYRPGLKGLGIYKMKYNWQNRFLNMRV